MLTGVPSGSPTSSTIRVITSLVRRRQPLLTSVPTSSGALVPWMPMTPSPPAKRDGARSHPLPTESRASSDPGPLEQLLDGEEQQALRVAFERLAPGDQEVLELPLVGGLSAAGATQVLGRREGAVRMAQSRALVRLRRLLEEVHGER